MRRIQHRSISPAPTRDAEVLCSHVNTLDEVVTTARHPRDEPRRDIDDDAREQIGVADRIDERRLADAGRTDDHDRLDRTEGRDASAIEDADRSTIGDRSRHRAV